MYSISLLSFDAQLDLQFMPKFSEAYFDVEHVLQSTLSAVECLTAEANTANLDNNRDKSLSQLNAANSKISNAKGASQTVLWGMHAVLLYMYKNTAVDSYEKENFDQFAIYFEVK